LEVPTNPTREATIGEKFMCNKINVTLGPLQHILVAFWIFSNDCHLNKISHLLSSKGAVEMTCFNKDRPPVHHKLQCPSTKLYLCNSKGIAKLNMFYALFTILILNLISVVRIGEYINQGVICYFHMQLCILLSSLRSLLY